MGATRQLATFVATTPIEALPASMLHEAKRTLINVLAVALSASVDDSVPALETWDGARADEATIVGRGRTSLGRAALVNGYLAHLQDYDDTHFPTILHPSAPTWPAVLAAAEGRGTSGLETLGAFVLGAEAACRVAMSVHPWHYDGGWHITGTAGVFGGVAGAARVLGLDVEATTRALGLGGTHAAGVREAFGTNGKAMHAGQAAEVGLRSAALAARGWRGPETILEGRRGFWAVASPGGHDASLLDGLDASMARWELGQNGLKPYANGVVSHPLQDATIELRERHGIDPAQVERIEARVHPLVLELMNRVQPTTGLEGKFSHQHCIAAALVDGAGHDAQFTDERVRDPRIASIRGLVHAMPDETLAEEATHLEITMRDGTTFATDVEHATGSPENPMSDERLEAKFTALAEPVLGASKARSLLDAAWHLDEAADVRGVMSLAST
ncbi:MAG: MmgE/PrpD family protein [Dehalococcoidia bacterium]